MPFVPMDEELPDPLTASGMRGYADVSENPNAQALQVAAGTDQPLLQESMLRARMGNIPPEKERPAQTGGFVPMEEESPVRSGGFAPMEEAPQANPYLKQMIAEMSPLDVVLAQTGAAMTGTYRGIKQILGIDEQGMAEDAAAMQALQQQRPGLSTTGTILGSLADPALALFPAGRATSLLSLAKTGAAAGGVAGGLNYTEPGGSRLTNAAQGAALGGMAAPALGTLISRMARGQFLPVRNAAIGGSDDVAKIAGATDVPASTTPDAVPPAAIPDPVPGKAGNIKLKNLDTTDDVKRHLVAMAEQHAPEIEDARRGVRSYDATKQAADDLGLTVDDLMTRRRGQAFNAEEATASRNLLVQTGEEVQDFAKANIGGGPEAKAAFVDLLSRHLGVQYQVSGMTAEAGRALNAYRIMAKSAKMRAQAIKNIVDKFGDDKIDEIMEAVSVLETPTQIAKAARMFTKPGPIKMVSEVWINAILSGPQTHVVNALSNTITNLSQIPERAIAAGIGKLHRGPKVVPKEAIAMLFGLKQGLKDGVSAALRSFKTNEAMDDLAKIEMASFRNLTGENLGLTGKSAAIADAVGDVIRLPGRFLLAADEFFKGVASRQELSALAVRKATQEGAKDIGARTAELLSAPTDEMLDAAHAAAQYVTFTKPLGRAGNAILTFKNEHPILNFIIPFVRTPLNIVKFAGERTPLALFSKAVRAELSKGGVARDMAVAKMAFGSTVMGTIASYAADGMISGGGPENNAEMAALRATGWQPYSIKIGDEWVSYARLEPLGILFGVSADAAEIAKKLRSDDEKDFEQVPVMLMAAISQNLTNKTFMRGLTESMQAMADPDRYGKKWWLSMSGSVVPTGVAQLARTQDPILRDAQTALEKIKSRIPGMSQDAPARRDIFGNEIRLEGGIGPDLLSPIYSSKEKNDPVANEIVRMKMRISPPQRTIAGKKMDGALYSEYARVSGQTAHQILTKVVDRQEYKQAPRLMKEQIIKKIFEDSRKMARVRLGIETQREQTKIETVTNQLQQQ